MSRDGLAMYWRNGGGPLFRRSSFVLRPERASSPIDGGDGRFRRILDGAKAGIHAMTKKPVRRAPRARRQNRSVEEGAGFPRETLSGLSLLNAPLLVLGFLLGQLHSNRLSALHVFYREGFLALRSFG